MKEEQEKMQFQVELIKQNMLEIFVKLADERNWNYNIIEAFDQPWKRVSEGAVGGYWGLFDENRADKNVFAGNVSNFPNYLYLALFHLD